MATKDSLQNNENPNASHRFPDYTVVYFKLIAPDLVTVYQIGAHYEENSFSRDVCLNRTFGEKTAKQTNLFKKACIPYFRGDLVVIASKTDAWKDFLKFLQSANNSVVLVTHGGHDDCFLLLRDLTELSLMEEFRKVCVGVIDTLPLCQDIFPGRGNYKLKELVKDKLGAENASGCQNATAHAINLEKLMKYAKVEPEMFQEHFFSLADLEYWCELKRERLLTKVAKKEARAKMTSSMETGEDSSTSLLSGRMKTTNTEVSASSEITPDVSKQVAAKEMTTKGCLPNGSHRFPDYTMVYFKLIAPNLETVCQIGAHFEENSFSRHVCPNGTFTEKAAKRMGLSNKDGILYLGGERVETVSKTDAWKDFLKFLQSASNSVVLVVHGKHPDCFLLLRDLTELSLMEEFRKVCVGVIDTLLLCQDIFPGRDKYNLKELVKDKLGAENASGCQNATADAINLEKLMKYAKVEPETFQQHLFSLADLEYWCVLKRERLLRKAAKKEARAKMTSSMETGEDSSTSLLSGRMKTTSPRVSATSEITPDVSKQVAAKNSLQNNENPDGSNCFSDYTMVYFNLIATNLLTVCEIGAHFEENSFSRHVCPNGTRTGKAAKQKELSNKDGILYLRGERIETVSRADAWKDFLKFLQSASNSVVLVVHGGHNFLLLHDLSVLLLMEEFRKVCVGVIDTLPLCQDIFPGREKYKLKELVKDKLGAENASGCQNATADAINLEKLIKYAKVEPEMFQEHFFPLVDFEYQRELKKLNLLRKKAEKEARAKMTSSMETGEDSSTSLLSGRMKTTNTEVSASSEITPDVSKQVAAKRMTAKDSLFNNYRPDEIQFSKYTLVYFDLEVSDFGRNLEVCQIWAHFMEKSFSKYVCPEGTIVEKMTELTGLSNKDGILYLGGERVETVSKMDAWKDFLKFLQSANNSVVLVMHDSYHDCIQLFHDLSELSLTEEFRKVCAGVIDTLPLSINIFPGREEIGKNYKLKELLQDNLGKEISTGGYNPITEKAILSLEKLIKYGNIQPEIFKQHFFSLSKLENWYQINRQAMLLRNNFPLMSLGQAENMARAGITYSDLVRSYVEGGEDGVASFLSHRMKLKNQNALRKEIIAITPVLEQQFADLDLQDGRQQSTNLYMPPCLRKKVAAKEMKTKDCLPNGSHRFPDYTMVYFKLIAPDLVTVCQIGAHFEENSFSRHVCPNGTFTEKAAKRMGLSNKDGILYLGGERVETVSKTDAWEDFLKFLQSASNSVVLVVHGRHPDCFLLLRDLTELSLMEEFRKVCVGVIDTLLLCEAIFPGRDKYKLKELVKDKLGEENASGCQNATAHAINLEKLMKYAKVEPETFQKHFFSLADFKCRCELKRERLLKKAAKKEARAKMTSSMETGEDSSTSLLSGRMKTTNTEVSASSEITPDVSKQVSADEMTTKGILQKNDNPTGGHHSSENKLVYLVLEAKTGSEICHIGAHFMEKIFSRFVCPIGEFTKGESKRTGLSKKNGILYLGEERVVTVSKMDAWEDFLKFLQSSNGSVTLVVHDRHNDCFLLFRELSQFSLMEEFRKVCAGVIDTLPLCRNVFPGREEIGKNYKLKELVQDNLGKEMSVGSHNAIVDATNLEKLMKHANVQPEIFQQHFFSLSSLEYEYQINRKARLLKRKFHFKKHVVMKMAEAGITCKDLEKSYIDGGEDGIASYLSGKINNTYPDATRRITKILNRKHCSHFVLKRSINREV